MDLVTMLIGVGAAKKYGPMPREPEELDGIFAAMMDGENTTAVFRQWWPMSEYKEQTKYERLTRWARMLALVWAEKTYTLRSYHYTVDGSSEMTPMADLAGKQAAGLASNTVNPPADWADNDPMTWYVRANALSLADGTMDIKALEFEEDFDVTGEDAPVYTFALGLCRREWSDGQYDYKSWRTMPNTEYTPYAENVAPDGSRRYLTWHPTYPGGLNSAGALTSGAGRKAYNFASAQTGIAAARKMTPYEGLWGDTDSTWALDMWQLRHFNLENSRVLEGCTNYNSQPTVAAAETGVRRVLLSAGNAAVFEVGSTVSVGDPGSNTNYDRGQGYMRNIADMVVVDSKETVTVGGAEYVALNLRVDADMDIPATAKVSTMPWHSGHTDNLPGHKDGSFGSLTNGRFPIRVAGVEMMRGAYDIGLDPLYNCTANPDGGFDYAIYECRDAVNQSGSIGTGYTDTGLHLIGKASGWQYVRAFAQNKKGILIPSVLGGGETTYYKSSFYGTYSAGVRCPWRYGNLNNGGNAGLACENGNNSPANANWNGCPRITV